VISLISLHHCKWFPSETFDWLRLRGDSCKGKIAAFMKNLLSLVFVFTSMLLVHADWTTDYKAALSQAKSQKKLVLLDFTGSDWCGYCKLLDKEVLAQPSFKDFADKNYVQVTLDFPHGKELPDELKQQNDALAKQFKIEGFPTLIVLNPDGTELGRQVGYNPGSGSDAVVAKLKSFNKN
jgi:thioredoxin-related protein